MEGPSLKGCELRLERANEHLAALDAERRAFLDEKDRRIVGHFDSDVSEYIFRVSGTMPSQEVGILASEFAHHLRAALDNLLWQLVLLRGGAPTRVTQFPIYERWEGYARRGDLMTRGVSTDDGALIELLQPYNAAPEAPDGHPLARLAWLNNTDKHRFLHACCVGVAPSSVPADILIGPDGTVPKRATITFTDEQVESVADFIRWWPVPVSDVAEVHGFSLGAATPGDDPAELLRVRITPSGPHPKVEVKDDAPLDIALSDGTDSILFQDLSILYDCVESIVGWFRPRFSL